MDESVHDHRCGGVGRIHGVDADAVPHRAERSEHLAAVDAPAAGDAFGASSGQADGHVVAGFAVARGEHLTGAHPLQDPRAGGQPEPAQVAGEADPVVVHARGQRGGRRVAGEPSLFAGELHQVQAEAAELDRRRCTQPADGAQIVEVVGGVPAVAVVFGARDRKASSRPSVRVTSCARSEVFMTATVRIDRAGRHPSDAPFVWMERAPDGSA